jgi:hypothetical protein
MGARTPQVQAATSSRARAIEAYYPFYPPPVYPEESDVKGGASGYSTRPSSTVDERTDKGIVDRHNNRWGDVTRYTWGGVLHKVFHMRATGQVESSVVQQVTNMPLQAQFNMWLYRAAKGYPRNMGLSEKVPTLPVGALGNNPWGQMQPRTQITQNVFTRRNYANNRSVPAQPMSG